MDSILNPCGSHMKTKDLHSASGCAMRETWGNPSLAWIYGIEQKKKVLKYVLMLISIHFIGWMETPSVTEWIRQLSYTEAHKSHRHPDNMEEQQLVRLCRQLLQRRHGASLAASSWAVSQSQSSTTTPKPVWADWEYLVRKETKDWPLAGGKNRYSIVHLWEDLLCHSSVSA